MMSFLRKSLLILTVIFSSQSFALTCDQSVLEQVVNRVIKEEPTSVIENGSVENLGDGFFEVYLQISDAQYPDVWPSHNYYEAVIDAQCKVYMLTLVETHM